MRAANRRGGARRIDDERCRRATGGLHVVGDAATLQAQPGVGHAGTAEACQTVEQQFAVAQQQQPRTIGELQAERGIGGGLEQCAASQRHALPDRGIATVGHCGGAAAHGQHAGLGRLPVQPGQRNAQRRTGWQLVGVGDAVVLLQAFPGHVGLQVFTRQVPDRVARSHAIGPVFGERRQRRQQQADGQSPPHARPAFTCELLHLSLPAVVMLQRSQL